MFFVSEASWQTAHRQPDHIAPSRITSLTWKTFSPAHTGGARVLNLCSTISRAVFPPMPVQETRLRQVNQSPRLPSNKLSDVFQERLGEP
jgi:hypothetical protein